MIVSTKALPDLSGRWTLDTTALVGSQRPVHVTMELTITQAAAFISIQRTGLFGAVEQDASVNRLAFDGSAAQVVTRTGDLTANGTASAGWDDSTLVVTTRLPGFSYPTVERFTLGTDAKTMSLSVTHPAAGGSVVAGRLLFVLRRK